MDQDQLNSTFETRMRQTEIIPHVRYKSKAYKSIEMEMNNEAARSKRIKRIFLLLDIAVSVSIPVTMKFLINAFGEDYVS